MQTLQKKPEPGGWQTDESGRRFRMLGNNCIEYEPTIIIDGVEIPQSELAAYHERKRAIKQARKEAEKNRPAPPPPKNCPFSDGIKTICTQEKCALYLKGCTLAQISDRPPAKATAGLQCPLSKYRHACRDDCALYKNGCVLTAIKLSEERED